VFFKGIDRPDYTVELPDSGTNGRPLLYQTGKRFLPYGRWRLNKMTKTFGAIAATLEQFLTYIPPPLPLFLFGH
jgi:hypothetical protein